MDLTPIRPASRAVATVLVFVGLAALALAGATLWRGASPDPTLVAVVRRGPITATLTTTGLLRPVRSLTYRSPVAGREMEITELAPEGTRVNAGDVLVRLETSDLERDADRLEQERQQAQLDLQVAAGETEEARGAVVAVSEGEGALAVDEARTRLQLAQKKVDRLREEFAQLKPLMDKGFITREELRKTGDQLDQSEEELTLARKRTDVVVQLTHPREQKRAVVDLAQKESQFGHARARLHDIEVRLEQLRQLIAACRMRALGPGLVVYEEYLNAVPRRKLRVGDRVFSSQGIVTIPEVDHMRVEASVGEAEVHRVRPGQPAAIRVEAFPDLRLTGHVSRVGTLASASTFRPLEDKRFDLLIDLDPSSADLRPEMTVRADVTVGTREAVLLVPVSAVFEQGGQFVVSVAGPRGVEVRPVDVGESNDRLAEVVAGLSEGDRVLLTGPLSSAASVAVPAVTPGAAPPAHALQPR